MCRVVVWSATIFLVFHFAAVVRADQAASQSATVSAGEKAQPVHNIADSDAARTANSQESFGSVVTEDYGGASNSISDIPEPASVVLLMIGGVLMFGRFRGRA